MEGVGGSMVRHGLEMPGGFVPFKFLVHFLLVRVNVAAESLSGARRLEVIDIAPALVLPNFPKTALELRLPAHIVD